MLSRMSNWTTIGSDADWVRRALGDDPKAFKVLVRRYQKKAHAIAQPIGSFRLRIADCGLRIIFAPDDRRSWRSRMRRCPCVLIVACSLSWLSSLALAQGDAPAGNPGVPWPATDALGRKLPVGAEAGPPRKDRWVGIFYFLWLNERRNKSPNWDGPYDVSRVLAADPEALKKPDSPLWGPIGTSHYWGRPLYDYYLSDDPWVLRRHAMLLADAGIDTLIFDTTNAEIYPEVVRKLCGVFEEVRKDGGRTPQIAFMVNTEAGRTAEKIHRELYAPGLHRDLWFEWRGKPLLICDPGEASEELRRFFTLRRAHWPFKMVNTANAWHWEAAYPQPFGFTDDPARPEQVNVSVAQNLRASDGQVTNMSQLDARGRSFHDGKLDTRPGAVDRGLNAEEQWKRARELDPPFVMVTGWNEWIAGRWGQPGGPVTFVDQFSQEFSRDIEPMAGGHRDNYYLQLAAGVRKYKGVPPIPRAGAPRTIRIDGGFDQWRDVAPEFLDHLGDAAPRDHDGAAGLHFADRSGRNDLEAFKVARDAEAVYFYARTREPISPSSGPGWMWLLIDIDRDAGTGWEGFDFIVNRTLDDGASWLEKNDGGWKWKGVAKVSSRVEGREMHLEIPLPALGITRGTREISLDFKWADNLQKPGEVMDFYLSGDVAPEGRFKYRYQAE